MPDGTTSILSMTWDAVKWLWFALAGLLVYNGKKIGRDVDEIKKDYVNSRVFNDTLKSLRGDIKDMKDDVRQDVSSVHQRIDKLMEK